MHVVVPAETRRKLDPKSLTCTSVGYAEDQGTRVYKLYHKETKRVRTSRDVVFYESPGEERAKDTRQSAGEGLASTPLSQQISKNRSISKSSQINQCGEEILRRTEENNREELRPSSSESSPLSSLCSDDGLEDTITVRGPILPLSPASTREISSPRGQGNTLSANESTGELSGAQRPQ